MSNGYWVPDSTAGTSHVILFNVQNSATKQVFYSFYQCKNRLRDQMSHKWKSRLDCSSEWLQSLCSFHSVGKLEHNKYLYRVLTRGTGKGLLTPWGRRLHKSELVYEERRVCTGLALVWSTVHWKGTECVISFIICYWKANSKNVCCQCWHLWTKKLKIFNAIVL